MKSGHMSYAFPGGRILVAVLTACLTIWSGPVYSASEPGTVTIVLDVEPRSLDPAESVSNYPGQVLNQNIVESLTEINADDSRILPRLATSWKQVDTNTWQFFLRKGVKFHDGADFSADVAVFNIKRYYDKRVPSNTREKYLTGVKMEGKALDSHTVEIRTEKFEPLLPTLMGKMVMCSPNTPADKVTRQPIGTGPYKLVKWDAGIQIILERFDGYWGRQPQVKKAVYLWRGESAVRAAMVMIGEADLAPNIAKQDANRPDMDISYFNSDTAMLRIGGEWEPPFNDRRVRLALNYAVDRNAIRGSILSKDVIPATHLIGPNIFGYNPDLKVWPYDPQKARQLLDEARRDGVPVDKEILLVGRIGIYSGAEELMEAVMAMYKAVGFNVKLRMVEASVYRPWNNKPYPTTAGPYILQKSHDNTAGDAAFTVFYNYHCKALGSTMCDKMTDDLIEKAEVAQGEERRKLWQAAFKRIYEDIVPNVMLFHLVGYARVGKRINFKPNAATLLEIQLSQITFR